ncbi:5117_t:CDS:2, partial [Scutellospora calospora]
NQTQFLQVLQEKKLVVESQEYQVEKIDKLKISFYPQTVNFKGVLVIPQEGSYLKLDFSANASSDYYHQYLSDPLQGISKRIAQRKNQIKQTGSTQETETPAEEEDKNYRQRLESEPFPPQIKKKILKEVRKLDRMHPWGSNRDVQEEYIEKLMSLPWWQTTTENKDLAAAQTELDKAGKKQSQVICLVGPPGTGKTSLGQSIAKATGRKFVKISVGGVHDESEIRGHRKTYIGAMPGRILQGMSQSRVVNPLFLIDEIDKVIDNVTGHHGNPTAALLEVLDPEQNEKFNDNYLGQDFPYDLSKVMFICTANNLENIPNPLRDRMDIIQLPPYTTIDKVQIAKNHSIPKILAKYELEKDQLTFTDEAIEEIINFYVHSGGVRTQERIFSRIADKFAVKQIKDNLKSEKIDLAKVREYLGFRTTERDNLVDYDEPGIEKLCKNLPKGGIPKDGPSAGITLTTAIISALTKKIIPQYIAMTGEITSKGKVSAIGGLREKITAAYEYKLKTIFIPWGNKNHLNDFPSQVKDKLEIIPVDNYLQI